MLESNLLLWAGLALLAVLGFNVGRVVKARNISGIVVMGDVHGNIDQRQLPQPPEPPKSPLWQDILTLVNVALAIVASAMVIGNFLLE